MFKPTIEHIEELMRAKEICESIIDEIEDNNYGYILNRANLESAAASIDKVLYDFSKKQKHSHHECFCYSNVNQNARTLNLTIT